MATRRALAFGLLLLALGLVPASTVEAQESEAPLFICGIWPNRVLFFDQTTDSFTEGLSLRYGAVTRSAQTSDHRRFFAVTNRMESVEVIDPYRREIVDELTLSTPEQRIRIFGVYPNADGTRLFLTANVTNLGTDRFERDEEGDVLLYDLETDRVEKRFSVPASVGAGARPTLYVAPDEKSYFVIAGDIFQVDVETNEVVDRVKISKPLQPGYGGFRGLRLRETTPGTFYGIYRTQDPIQEKDLFGVAELALYDKKVTHFDLGPSLKLGLFALSPDGKYGYAGLQDMVRIDMEKKKVVLKKEGFERGRANTSMIVSHDGTKLYVSGVGDTMYIYDASTLEPIDTVFAGGDFMMVPVEVAPQAAASGQ